MKKRNLLLFSIASSLLLFMACSQPQAKETVLTDSNAPLHLLDADHGVPYGMMSEAEIHKILKRVYSYLESTTPTVIVDAKSGTPISGVDDINEQVIFKKGDYRLVSYEWGVTYAAMLLAGDITGDKDFTDYSVKRINFLSEMLPYFKQLYDNGFVEDNPMRTVIEPRALDDSGAMSAAMIKAVRAGHVKGVDNMIENYIDYITNKQLRLDDGTLARHRPQQYTLWLDDLFMSVPALAQMGIYSGDVRYFDDAVNQVLNFSKRMFNYDLGLYMHGYVTGMEVHPEFRWARANGWAIMTKVELLDVLPESHPGRQQVLDLLKAHVAGLANVQSGYGFWHQLLDRNDSYLETSATAIFVYSMAKAINEGWIDKQAYGPVVSLAWNAVSTKINDKGQVEGTCVGTGMGFDPAFYYARPVNVFAAHSYGPVVLAGAEMIRLYRSTKATMNDSAFLFYDNDAKIGDEPIFYLVP